MAEKHIPGFLSDEDFATVLKSVPMATFDLVIEVPDQGVLIARRRIPPYNHTWALPGLRQRKGERITDVLGRIARDEAGVKVDLSKARILGQHDGLFRTEHNRQDTSTGYLVPALSDELQLNPDHFTSHRIITGPDQIPEKTGAMYKHYLNLYFEQQVEN